MRAVESLEKIRPGWLSRISTRLAHGEGIRESFLQQLTRLFTLLKRAVESNDPACLDPLLDEWVGARTETEIENSNASLLPVLDQIILLTYETAREDLEEVEALDLLGALLPVYLHAAKYTSSRETNSHIEYISRELEKAKTNLERLDKSKSDFIAVAAHELKTPLTLIEGYLSMLREILSARGLLEQTEILLKGVDNGSRRLREIVDDMIDVSMIDNDLLSLNFQPVWINRLLKSVQEDFSETIGARRLLVEIEPFPGSEEVIFGDEERLQQAFHNVLSNAIKFTPDGGKIVVSGRKLPGFLEVTVADTGIGIDPEDQSRIFEKFGRLGNIALHSSGKTKFKGGGPGLGLPITKGIIEAHGGAVWAESKGYDESSYPGTIFHILLPLRKEPPDHKTAKLFKPLLDIGR